MDFSFFPNNSLIPRILHLFVFSLEYALGQLPCTSVPQAAPSSSQWLFPLGPVDPYSFPNGVEHPFLCPYSALGCTVHSTLKVFMLHNAPASPGSFNAEPSPHLRDWSIPFGGGPDLRKDIKPSHLGGSEAP